MINGSNDHLTLQKHLEIVLILLLIALVLTTFPVFSDFIFLHFAYSKSISCFGHIPIKQGGYYGFLPGYLTITNIIFSISNSGITGYFSAMLFIQIFIWYYLLKTFSKSSYRSISQLFLISIMFGLPYFYDYSPHILYGFTIFLIFSQYIQKILLRKHMADYILLSITGISLSFLSYKGALWLITYLVLFMIALEIFEKYKYHASSVLLLLITVLVPTLGFNYALYKGFIPRIFLFLTHELSISSILRNLNISRTEDIPIILRYTQPGHLNYSMTINALVFTLVSFVITSYCIQELKKDRNFHLLNILLIIITGWFSIVIYLLVGLLGVELIVLFGVLGLSIPTYIKSTKLKRAMTIVILMLLLINFYFFIERHYYDSFIKNKGLNETYVTYTGAGWYNNHGVHFLSSDVLSLSLLELEKANKCDLSDMNIYSKIITLPELKEIVINSKFPSKKTYLFSYSREKIQLKDWIIIASPKRYQLQIRIASPKIIYTTQILDIAQGDNQ